MLISVLGYASIVCCITDQKILFEKTSVQNHDVQSILQIHFRLDSCVNEDHTIIMKKRIAQFENDESVPSFKSRWSNQEMSEGQLCI